MRTRRVYVDSRLSSDQTLELPQDTAHYLRTVLRLADQSSVILFNGTGTDYAATINYVGKRQVVATVAESVQVGRESALEIELGIGLSRGERMDFIMQKCTELGVQTITPLFTSRCEVKIDERRLEKRLEHWRRITISACEQCGRSHLTRVNTATDISVWCQQHSAATGFILHPGEGAKPLPSRIPSTRIAVLIGPEGGFDAREVTSAISQGFANIRLGPRILRTETAPIAAVSAMQTLWGDFRK